MQEKGWKSLLWVPSEIPSSWCRGSTFSIVLEGHGWTLRVSFPTGEVQAFYEDLNGRQYVNEVFNFSVDKLYDLLFTDSQFQRDFMEQRRFSGELLLLELPQGLQGKGSALEGEFCLVG